MRKPLVAGNWKMFTTPPNAAKLADELKSVLGGCNWADIVVCPPYTSIYGVVFALRDSAVEIGAQNLFWENEGAYTGEISADMIRDAGCSWAIIGHSERRGYFNETDENVYKKTKAAIAAGLKPIVCVGETLDQRDKDITETIIENQLVNGLGRLDNISSITIAYEPVWAIGTGRTATPEQAQEVHKFLRNIIFKRWGGKFADLIRILYGGSVKPDNAAGLYDKEDIDGFLVGGASLKADSFARIAESVK